MLYRRFGKGNFEVSSLGFGCMRLPFCNGDDAQINETEAISMIRYAIDQGVNYVDTAYPYHKGNSEVLVGKALKDGYREKVHLATKLPVWLCNSYADFEKYLEEQLTKLQTESIDCYLLHALNKVTWQKSKELGVLRFLDSALAQGKIKHVGFSFHDDVELFKEIVYAYPWTFCQIQYNYMDERYQAGTEGLKYAAAKGLAVIVMEPLKGGRLAKKPPTEVQGLWSQAEVSRTPADWALRWVWNQPEVSLVLSGMSTMENVVENINTASEAAPLSLQPIEVELIDLVKTKYKELVKVGCTACGYCMPCPAGVDIPRNFATYNEAFMYNNVGASALAYNRFMDEKVRASACVECGQCEEACPQQIGIREQLKDVHRTLHQA
ncbi:MAG TPA: aldo/keto reductase [Candidatus Deferrimicrobium sp.]|nr:aldo/keto reductase [Candidatus Deferrimicrobium sp.]